MACHAPTVVPRGRTRLAARGALAVLAALLSVEVAAQETPGLIEQRFQSPAYPQAALQRLELKTSERLPPSKAERIKFVLVGVVVEGATVYRDIDFLPLYEPYLKREVSLADVYQIADAITAKYQNDGYILSRVIVPPQRIRGGIVRLRLVEEGG